MRFDSALIYFEQRKYSHSEVQDISYSTDMKRSDFILLYGVLVQVHFAYFLSSGNIEIVKNNINKSLKCE